MAVKLVVDSASDISEEEAKKLGISMIPIVITFDDVEYLDGIDLLPNEFYDKLAKTVVNPKTSQINAFRFEEEFEELTKNGDEVVAIILSSKLSGTYNNAVNAAKKFGDKVYVVDSLNACTGQRILTQYALQLIIDGKSAKEIAEVLNEAKTKIKLFAMIDTLEYLKRGGRISSIAAFAGKLLSIKPLISVVEGEVKVIGKALGSKLALNFLNKQIDNTNGIDFDKPYGLVYSGNDDSSLKKYIQSNANKFNISPENVPSYILGATIGAHIGPGGIGIAYFEK